MKQNSIPLLWVSRGFAISVFSAGLVTASAQQQGGGRQIDPAQIQQRLQQLGGDPAQMLERLQQMGVDTSQILERARQNGVDLSQFGGAAGQSGAAGLTFGVQNRLDPAQILDRTIDAYQEQLEFSDDEWAAVRPLVRDVVEKRNALMAESAPSGILASFGAGRAATGIGNAARQVRTGPEPSPAETALRTAIDSSAAAAEIKAKLDEFRSAKKKQEDELKAAREKLRKVLSVRREAKAVLAGLLE